MTSFVLVLAAAACSAFAAAPADAPEKLRTAPVNTWVKLVEGQAARRSSPGLVWVPRERSFVCFGGRMGMLPKHQSPYSEMTLNLPECRWENRFPKGKLGPWGDLTGPSKAPQFPGSYYAVRMKDAEGNVRPYLGSGYDRAMYLYNNAAWDSDRGRVVLAWHLGAFTAEYDPVERTWHVIDGAKDVPAGFWDDFLWGAMCYDPVNREVLGGRGRWAYSAKTGTWRRLEFHSKLLDPLRASAEKLRRRAKDLVGAGRSRYYLSETPEEAKADLSQGASLLDTQAAALGDALAKSLPAAPTRERALLGWAAEELARARTLLSETATLLEARVTPAAIHKSEDARDGLERCALWLAVEPPPRAFSPMAYDARNKAIVLFGGDRQDRKLADTWVYDCASRVWQQRRPKLSPPPRAGHGLVYLPKSGKVLLVDGYGIGATGQCWVYDTAADEWSLLAEGSAKRPVLTPRPHYSFMPGPLAATPDDVVVMLCRRETFRGRPSPNGTWAARIDPSRIDAEGTAKLGVPPLTMSEVRGTRNPRWYEAIGEPPDTSAADRLEELPANTWVRVSPPNCPKANRAWGTTVLDTARDQILQYGGGHAAYSGNDVLHYSIRANRCSTGSFHPELMLNWNASMIGPPTARTFGGRPFTQHSYHNYGFDPPSGKMIAYCRSTGRFHVYDPLTRDWQAAFGRRFATYGTKGWVGLYHNITCVPTPQGLVAWVPGHGILRLDAAALAWRKLPLQGELPRMSVDNQGVAFDSKRNRLLLFTKQLKGNVTACDLKTGQVARLTPPGADRVSYRPRETLYVPPADGVLIGAHAKLSDGRPHWLFYHCARNAWLGLHLPGQGVAPGFSLGLMYDPKRRLIWAADSRLTLAALRLDLPTAQVRPLADEPPAPPRAP